MTIISYFLNIVVPEIERSRFLIMKAVKTEKKAIIWQREIVYISLLTVHLPYSIHEIVSLFSISN